MQQAGKRCLPACAPMNGSGRKVPASLLVPEHNGYPDLVLLMMLLGKQQINSVWVGGRGHACRALLQAGPADELIVYIAPKLLGKCGAWIDARCRGFQGELEPGSPILNSMRYVRLARM